MANLNELIEGNKVLTSAVYNLLIIEPLTEIVFKLEANEYKDSDIKMLLNKRKDFGNLALDTINVKFSFPSSKDYVTLNGYVKSTLTAHFKTLLKHFLSFKQNSCI